VPTVTGPLLHDEGNIMLVDDNPASLKLLERVLRERGYEVRSFPRGHLALAGANHEPPDLILLDINMPGMNGYEVCQQLKSSERLSGIPVIFLSALDAAENKVKGFLLGAVDYISKPFQLEEVQARVEIHIKLRRAQQAGHDLMERTLGGAVGALWELVEITSPVLALRGRAIRDIVLWITKRVEIKDARQFELAAAICLVGCIGLPDDVLEKAYCGQDLSSDEDRMFRDHPERAARVLSNIPGLEVAAEIIRSQREPGASVLHLALELDRRIYQGVNSASALAELRSSGRFDGRMLGALTGYSPPAQAEFDVRRLPVRELRAGMILESDVVDNERKLLILKEGTVLKDTWIERLENFSNARGTEELIDVRIPRLAGPRKAQE
jgi:DNA-binding response OmpR family regulator